MHSISNDIKGVGRLLGESVRPLLDPLPTLRSSRFASGVHPRFDAFPPRPSEHPAGRVNGLWVRVLRSPHDRPGRFDATTALVFRIWNFVDFTSQLG